MVRSSGLQSRTMRFIVARASRLPNLSSSLLGGQPPQRHMLMHFRPNGGKRIGECNDVLVFRAFMNLTKAGVVAVLLSPLGITTRGLDVPVRERTNPDICPGRRDCQCPDPSERLWVRESRPIRPSIGESISYFFPAHAGPGVRNMSQARTYGILRIDNWLRALR